MPILRDAVCAARKPGGAWWLGALIAPFILFSSTAQAAVDVFLSLGKDIPGESTDGAHSGAVDVLSWSWGLANSGSTHIGGGGGAGKVSFQDLSVTKYVDKASPKLMAVCAAGTHIPEATLFVRKAGQVPFDYIKITLSEVLVTSVSTGGSSGEDRLTENVTLNFAKVKFEYTTTKKDGTAGATIPFGWNIAENTPD